MAFAWLSPFVVAHVNSRKEFDCRSDGYLWNNVTLRVFFTLIQTTKKDPCPRNHGKHVVIASHLLQKVTDCFRGFLDQNTGTGIITAAIDIQSKFRLGLV